MQTECDYADFMKRGSKKTMQKAVRVHIPISPGRNGLIRYMQRGSAVPKPERLFQYDALALLIVDVGTCTYLIDEKQVECPKGSMIWGFPESGSESVGDRVFS
jgi:hypothetical protein